MSVEAAFVVEARLGTAKLACSTYIVVEHNVGNGLWEGNTYFDSTSDPAAVILLGERGNRTRCCRMVSLLFVAVLIAEVADRLELAGCLCI